MSKPEYNKSINMQSLKEFATGDSGGNGPFDYGSAIVKIGEDFLDHYNDYAAGQDSADIIAVGKTFMSKGMTAGIAALFELDTQVYNHVLDQLSDQGFNVDLDIISNRKSPKIDKSTQDKFIAIQNKFNAQPGNLYLVTGYYEYGRLGSKLKASSPEEAKQKFIAMNSDYKFSKVDVKQQDGAQGVAESFSYDEYNDEAGLAESNLHTLTRAVNGLLDTIEDGDNLPEWCQEKIAKAEMMLVSVWDYLQSQKAQGIDPQVDTATFEELDRVLELSGIQLTETVEAQFDCIEEMVESLALEHGVDSELIWEDFESVSDEELYESAAWRRKEGKNKNGGLNARGVASYRRENPGSKLQTAVTTKPSKLKPGSKAARRRKSFCARMSGVKGPMKKPNGKPTRKALALRKWNC